MSICSSFSAVTRRNHHRSQIMFRGIIRPCRSSIQPSSVLQIRYASRKKVVAPPLRSSAVKDFPNEFSPLLTRYGWFVIPTKFNIVDWTIPELNKEFDEKIAPSVELEGSGAPADVSSESYRAIQEVIDDWVFAQASTAKSPLTKAKAKKRASSKAKSDKEILSYLDDLKANIQKELNELNGPTDEQHAPSQSESPSQGDSESKSTRSPSARNSSTSNSLYKSLESLKLSKTTRLYPKVSVVKAWNYYFSKMSPTIEVGPGEKKITILAATWNKLEESEKEAYRREYGAILESGYDISSGKIVPKDKKRKNARKSSKAKREEKEKEEKEKEES